MPPAKPKSKTSPKKKLKTARLEVRLTAEQKKRIERAAAKQGRTLSEYVVGRALGIEDGGFSESNLLVLSPEDRKVLMEALRNPPKANAALSSAWREHRGSGRK